MFDQKGPDRRMKMFYFDIPNLHRRSKTGVAFIKALDNSDETDIFSLFTVQALINFHWRRVKIISYLNTMIPYLIQLATFTYWSNVVLESGQVDHAANSSLICIRVLQIISFYFLLLELN